MSLRPSQPDAGQGGRGLEALQARLGYVFENAELLQLALTHPSVAYEAPGERPHNQRLEFLGDAVLGLILSRELYERFPDSWEGGLTKARAHMVNRRTLASQARHLGLGDYLILSRGEESSGGRQRASSLADAFEAVLGAIFIDGGYERARDFVLIQFRKGFGELREIPNVDNPKGELQEYLQSQSAEAPTYKVTAVEGPDHDRVFECAVVYRGEQLGSGRGKSKKAAESEAAYEALITLRKQARS